MNAARKNIMLGSRIDSILAKLARRGKTPLAHEHLPTRQLDTPVGAVRVFDSAAGVANFPDLEQPERYAALLCARAIR